MNAATSVADSINTAAHSSEGGNSLLSLPNIMIAYGSETGTAEAAASSLARNFKICRPALRTLNDVSKLDRESLQAFTHIAIICSTFGKGEPPKNAMNFFSVDLTGKLNKGAKFAVLALGSSLYPDYCKAGKDADNKMKDAGAVQISEITCADSAHGDQATIREWTNRIKKLILPDSLHAKIKTKNSLMGRGYFEPSYVIQWQESGDNSNTWLIDEKSDGSLQCVANTELFEDAYSVVSARSTRHIELELPDDMSYETGDHLSVAPVNEKDAVARFCNSFAHELERAAVKSSFFALKLDGETRRDLVAKSVGLSCTPSLFWQIHQPFYIDCLEDGHQSLHTQKHLINTSLVEVLRKGLDLSFHSTSYLIDFLSMLLRKLDKVAISSATADDFRAEVTSIGLNDDFDSRNERIKIFIDKYPTIVDFLEGFEEIFCRPSAETKGVPLLSLADVLVLIPCLKPRQYSISSSQAISPGRISITTGVINFVSNEGVWVKGVCSNYLAGLTPGQYVDAKIVTSSFRPPNVNSCPVIMISTGTGLGPFMGFLQERADSMAESNYGFGQCHLFFGCRSDEEFIYSDQIIQWESEGIVTLHLAQSRQKEHSKKYVQDALEDYGEELVSLLMSRERTKVYICGNAEMADDCSDTCIDILKKYGQMSILSATQLLSSMRISNRWELDVWGQAKPHVAVKILQRPRLAVNKSQRNWISNF